MLFTDCSTQLAGPARPAPARHWVTSVSPSASSQILDRCRSQTQGRRILGLGFCSAAAPLARGSFLISEMEIITVPTSQ